MMQPPAAQLCVHAQLLIANGWRWHPRQARPAVDDLSRSRRGLGVKPFCSGSGHAAGWTLGAAPYGAGTGRIDSAWHSPTPRPSRAPPHCRPGDWDERSTPGRTRRSEPGCDSGSISSRSHTGRYSANSRAVGQLITGLSVLLVLALVAAGIAVIQQRAAEHQRARLTGHTDTVHSASSPDGHTLATASDDDTARLSAPVRTLIVRPRAWECR
jgi:hypothetical protein